MTADDEKKPTRAGSAGEVCGKGEGTTVWGGGLRMRQPSLRGVPACACTRGRSGNGASGPRGRASGQRAEVGVRAEVAGRSRGLGGDRACR